MTNTGDNSSDLDASLINVGRGLVTAIKWVIAHGKAPSKLAGLRWAPDIAHKAEQAVRTALRYDAFETAFPMWHKGRYAAQLMSPRVVRFSSLSSVRERQVSAYQKGFRPTTGEYEGKRAKKPDMRPETKRLFDTTLESAVKEGRYRFDARPTPGICKSTFFPSTRRAFRVSPEEVTRSRSETTRWASSIVWMLRSWPLARRTSTCAGCGGSVSASSRSDRPCSSGIVLAGRASSPA